MIALIVAWAIKAQTLAVAEKPAAVLVAADVARCESSAWYSDGAAVLGTVLTRARLWRRSVLDIMLQPGQHAHGCPCSPRTWNWRHLRLGLEAVFGHLDAPNWTARATHYCHTEAPGTCESWCRGGCVPVGRVVHTFYGEPEGG